MKKLIAIIAMLMAVAFVGATIVEAGQCPTLIKQVKEGATKVSDTKKKAEVDKLVAEAEKLHADGKHAESVKKAEEAAKVAGVTLQKKM